jgi:uncharacterized protein
MRELTMVLLLAAAPAWVVAQDPTLQVAAEGRTLTVSATGMASRTPDRAVLTLAVETFAETAREASAANARQMEQLVAAIRRAGIPQERIRTTGYNLMPEYDYRERQQPRLVGYRTQNLVLVTSDDVAGVGALIDAAVGAGANRVHGLHFQVRDGETARHEALRQAAERARAEAEVLAAALGQRLGPPIAVYTGGAQPPIRPMTERMMSMDAVAVAPTPIEPGALELQASVTIVYRLESP